VSCSGFENDNDTPTLDVSNGGTAVRDTSLAYRGAETFRIWMDELAIASFPIGCTR
jgi:hypothetical protein